MLRYCNEPSTLIQRTDSEKRSDGSLSLGVGTRIDVGDGAANELRIVRGLKEGLDCERMLLRRGSRRRSTKSTPTVIGITKRRDQKVSRPLLTTRHHLPTNCFAIAADPDNGERRGYN
jgi:hypothetical protein